MDMVRLQHRYTPASHSKALWLLDTPPFMPSNVTVNIRFTKNKQ